MTTTDQDYSSGVVGSDLRAMAEYHSNISPKNKKLLRVLADYIEDGEPGPVEPTAHTAVIVHVAPRWIAVGEGLPAVLWGAVKASQLVTIARDDRIVSFGHLIVTAVRGPYWFDDYLRRVVVVTHWQPLPDLPEVSR